MNFNELDEETRRNIAVSDAKDDLPDDIAVLLREPDNLRAWRATLISLIQSSDAQIPLKRAELLDQKKHMEFQKWKQTNQRFRQSIESRLNECKELIHKQSQESYTTQLRNERDMLVNAIKKHRNEFGDLDEASEGDEELWAVLDRFL